MAGAAFPAVIPVVRPSHLVERCTTHGERFIVSFAGLGFLTFYLAGKLRLFDTRGYAVSDLSFGLKIRRWLKECLGQGVVDAGAPRNCLLGGALAYDGLPTCVFAMLHQSRSYFLCLDHWEDVLTGSALGLGVAYFSYRQYYPHLASKTAHIPFKTRFEEMEYNLDNGTAIFSDGDADNEEVGLIGGSRKPQTQAR